MAVRSCNQRKRVVYKILNKAYLILHFSMYLEQFFQYFYYRNRRLTVLQKEVVGIGNDVKYTTGSTLLVTNCISDSTHPCTITLIPKHAPCSSATLPFPQPSSFSLFAPTGIRPPSINNYAWCTTAVRSCKHLQSNSMSLLGIKRNMN